MCGTETAYGGVRCAVRRERMECGTEIAYGAVRYCDSGSECVSYNSVVLRPRMCYQTQYKA
eukprot:2404321-Rhodomonas_salina.1